MRRLAIALLCTLASVPAGAFKLQAFSNPAEKLFAGSDRQSRAFMRQFASDVHERMTRKAYEAAGLTLDRDVITGVRWNDNPPAIRFGPLLGGCSGPKLQSAEGFACWTSMLRFDLLAWEALSKREQSLAPMRSHFGDMQFLHAMASRSGEPPEQTRRNILRWAQFAYRVARGEIAPRANLFGMRRYASALDEDTGQWVSDLFRGPAKKLWAVHDVFLPISADLKQMAFGSLLHMIEDSYSAAHVLRESTRLQANGCASYDANDPILRFQTYAGQDAAKHGVCDDEPDWLTASRPGSPIDVLAEVVLAYHQGRDWLAMRALLEDKVFRLSPAAAPARPGHCFEMRPVSLEEGVGPEHVVALEAGCRAQDVLP
jgi:hypothetical protein